MVNPFLPVVPRPLGHYVKTRQKEASTSPGGKIYEFSSFETDVVAIKNEVSNHSYAFNYNTNSRYLAFW